MDTVVTMEIHLQKACFCNSFSHAQRGKKRYKRSYSLTWLASDLVNAGTQQQAKMFLCQEVNCGRQFRRRYDLNQHIQHVHGNELTERCLLCGQIFKDCASIQEHFLLYHKPSRHFIVKESAFNRNIVTYRYNYLETETDFVKAQLGVREIIRKQILREAAEKIVAKVSLIIMVEMIMIDHSGQQISRATIPFRAPTFTASAHMPSNIDMNIRRSFAHQRQTLEEFLRNGSGWVFQRALAIDVETAKMKPIRVGANKVDISGFKNKRWLYNPSFKNNHCFLYCIAYFILFGLIVNKKITLQDELQMKKKIASFNIKGLTFPITVEEVKKFVNRNPQLDLSINILMRDSLDIIYPLEYGIGNGKKVVNLLLLQLLQGNHFLVITNPDKFLRQTYLYGEGMKKRSYQKAFFCLHCLNHFYSPELRNAHVELCCLTKARREKTPNTNEAIMKFRQYEHQHKLDYIAFLDFECVLPANTKICDTCSSLKCKCETSSTIDLNHQIPVTYSFVVIGPNDKIIHERTYSGKNAHFDFITHLLDQEENWIKPLMDTIEIMVLSPKEEKAFQAATSCYLCEKPFTIDIVKCRDHSHSTGYYLGAACQSCNLRRRRPSKLRIFSHNSSKYDMHFIIKALSMERERVNNISVLPYNGEHFRTLAFNSFVFLDSLSFLASSLAQLSDNLKASGHTYPLMKQTYLAKSNGHFSSKRLENVLKKSFFPYEYCQSFEQMMSTTELPAKEAFNSALHEEGISQENYGFAKSMWKEYKCRNLIDYTELYCKIDTILLAEIFTAFRHKMINFTGLDPAYYISLPSFGYDAMLKITKAEIELLTDISMVHFFEQAKRGGVSFINTRHLSVKDGENAALIYIDRNNLYGESQLRKLPYNNFRWLTPQEVAEFDLQQNFDGEKGYFLEVDLKYPKRLHKKHNNLPLAPEMLEVNFENLSPYSQEAVEQTEGHQRYKDTKLMSTFYDKEKYVLHVKVLLLYMSLGLELTYIHRIVEFSQKNLFAPYIRKTNLARQQATNKFDSDLYKLMVKKSSRNFNLIRCL